MDDQQNPESWRSLHLSGAAELIEDPDEARRIAAAFPVAQRDEQPARPWRLYRITLDEAHLLENGAERPAAGVVTAAPTAAQALPAAARLRAAAEERIARPGETIVRQGEPADRFYVIIKGACEVVRETGGGTQTLARLGPGHFFGETGLLAGVPRTASVIAVEDVRLLSLTRAQFRAALAEIGRSAERLAQVLYAGPAAT